MRYTPGFSVKGDWIGHVKEWCCLRYTDILTPFWWRWLPAETQIFACLSVCLSQMSACCHGVTILPRLAASFLSSAHSVFNTRSDFSFQWWLSSSHSLKLDNWHSVLDEDARNKRFDGTHLYDRQAAISAARVLCERRKKARIQEKTSYNKAFGMCKMHRKKR